MTIVEPVPITLRSRPNRSARALFNPEVFVNPVRQPLAQYIVKVAGRCNLNCDYCYMYEKYDQSWKEKPRLMSDETVKVIARRIDEHVQAHREELKTSVTVILHGGEPLMAGPERVRRFVETMRDEIHDLHVEFGMQTNGLLLTSDWIELCQELGIGLGVSIDGDKLAHDRHRLTHRGRSSHAKVEAAIDLLMQPHVGTTFGGAIAVIDIANDPKALYEYFKELDVPGFSLLMPEATWDDPPPGKDVTDGSAPYGDWLSELFDAWFDDPEPNMKMRHFDSLLSLLMGGPAYFEGLGLGAQPHVSIETDGTVVTHESLRGAFPGASTSNVDLHHASFDDVLKIPSMVAAQNPEAALSAECRACPIVEFCGAGDLGHRYREGNGFDNPTVYCTDMAKLIQHVNNRVHQRLRQQIQQLNLVSTTATTKEPK